MKYQRNFYEIISNDEIFQRIQKEKDSIGYYKLPYQDTSHIKDYVKKVSTRYIIVVGIGGSSLGVEAIYNFLNPVYSNLKEIIFLDSTDPFILSHKIKNFQFEDSHFIFISKSGNTIETISLMKVVNSFITIDKINSTIITSKGSDLHQFAKRKKINTFFIPDNVGGRFSVFSASGLIPLAMANIDIDKILAGARDCCDNFFSNDEYRNDILSKARFIVENKKRFNTNVIFAYSSLFEFFLKWYIQLWAESLGKKNINGTRQGLNPVGLIGPTDQHSYLQLIMDGVRDKTITFIKIESSNLTTDFNKFDAETFSNLEWREVSEKNFHYILNFQANSTIKSIEAEKDIPYDVITVNEINEFCISKLMFSYQLLVSAIGQFLQINTYDQPGVEAGKINLKKILNTQ